MPQVFPFVPQKPSLASNTEIFKEKFSNFLNNREHELADAIDRSLMMKIELENFGDIKQSLARSLNVATTKIHFYGSRVMGLANVESDLDIYVEMLDSFYSGISKEQQQLYLDDFKVQLGRNRDWKVGIEIRDATVPILNLVYIPRNIKCEISVRNGLGVVNSKLLAHLFTLQPNAIKFFHFIRKWLLCAGFEFKGFQLALLVLFFLQTRGFVPGVNRVQKKLPVVKIKGWNVQFDEQQQYNGNTWIHFKKSLWRFFEYYQNFNYAQLVIFPHLGDPVPKLNYARQKSLKGLPVDKFKFKFDLPMSMAGPVTCDYNITQDVSAKKLENFKDLCQMSFMVLRPLKLKV